MFLYLKSPIVLYLTMYSCVNQKISTSISFENTEENIEHRRYACPGKAPAMMFRKQLKGKADGPVSQS